MYGRIEGIQRERRDQRRRIKVTTKKRREGLRGEKRKGIKEGGTEVEGVEKRRRKG